MDISKETLLNTLAGFTGTETYYYHPLIKKFNYTDGVQYLAKEAEAYWLIEKIFFTQFENKKLQDEAFQVWTLSVNEDKTATLSCHDGNYNYQHKEKIEYSDFPLNEISLYFINNVLLLTSEY